MSNSRRVLMLLSNPFRPDPRVLKEAESLAAAGYEITIICWDRLSELPPEETLSTGVKIIRIQDVPSSYGLGLRQLLRLPAFWIKAMRRLNSLNPSIVHCHDFDTLLAGLWWGWRHGTPVIYDAHEYYAELVRPRLNGISRRYIFEAIRRAELWCAGRAAAVVTVDETLGEIYRQRNSKVLVVGHYPPVNLVPAPSETFSSLVMNLLYVGRISTDRGSLVYLQLLRNLLDRGIPARLHLAGSFIHAPSGRYSVSMHKDWKHILTITAGSHTTSCPACSAAQILVWRSCCQSHATLPQFRSSYLNTWQPVYRWSPATFLPSGK